MVTNKLASIALAAAPIALLAAAPAHAQATVSQVHAGSLEVPKNKSQVVTADRPIAKAMIGNPDIADIVPLSDRSIYVLGKSMGTTSLTLYDRVGRVLAVMDVSVGPDVETFRSMVGFHHRRAYLGQFEGSHRTGFECWRGGSGCPAGQDLCRQRCRQHDLHGQQPAGHG